MALHRHLAAAVALAVLAGVAASAQEMPQSVSFVPLQSSGVLQGCTLVYATTHIVLVSGELRATVLSGSIGVSRGDRGIVVFLKLGGTDPGRPDSPLQRPHFAYLQTKSATTAKSTPNIADGDEGYRLFAGPLDASAQKVVLEMLTEGKVEIGFNRSAGGLDLIVPLNLKITATDTPLRFLDCMQEVLRAEIDKP